MPKGRIFAPSTEKDGKWYPHRGVPEEGSPLRVRDTTTGLMLSGPYTNTGYPPSPPPTYTSRDKNFKNSNNFSDHDNRNSFQDHGVYFGDGQSTRHLGKRLHDSLSRQHVTDKEFLKHHSRLALDFDYDTIYSSDFTGKLADSASKRRFPRHYTEGQEGPTELPDNPTRWHSGSATRRLPIKVLATSQQPYLKHNVWKYSYHGLAGCYPSTLEHQICGHCLNRSEK